MNVIETSAFLVSAVLLIASAVLQIIMLSRSGHVTGGSTQPGSLSRAGRTCALLAWCFLTISIIARAIETSHGPFSNMYEFTVAFTWGVLGALLLVFRGNRAAGVGLGATVVALVLLIAAFFMPSRPVPLVPALQQSALLSAHVASAVFAYGAFTIAFVAAVLYLARSSPDTDNTELRSLEDLSYRAAAIGFPFMTLVIVLGALWADIAWGRYWGWDPKETASLVTWLIYAGYLHARALRGWRGRKAALFLVVGFVAVLLTFFGNYVFNGLHAYG